MDGSTGWKRTFWPKVLLTPRMTKALAERADELLEQRLDEITRATPQFAAALRAYRAAQRTGDHATAEGLAGWLAGQPHIAASIKREAGIKGDVDHFAALSFLRGLLLILKDSGYSGLVLVLDEIETIQRVRSDVREKGLNALRQLIDDIDGGRFPESVSGHHRHACILRWATGNPAT